MLLYASGLKKRNIKLLVHPTPRPNRVRKHTDLTGRVFGKLTVLEDCKRGADLSLDHVQKAWYWLCQM